MYLIENISHRECPHCQLKTPEDIFHLIINLVLKGGGVRVVFLLNTRSRMVMSLVQREAGELCGNPNK